MKRKTVSHLFELEAKAKFSTKLLFQFSDFGCYTFDKHGNYLEVSVYTHTFCSHFMCECVFSSSGESKFNKTIIQVFKWILTLLTVVRCRFFARSHTYSLSLSLSICWECCIWLQIIHITVGSSLSTNVLSVRIFCAIPICLHLDQYYPEYIWYE